MNEKTTTKLYKIQDENGNALLGYKTKEEAERFLPEMKEGREWHIISYTPDEWELDNDKNNN